MDLSLNSIDTSVQPHNPSVDPGCITQMEVTNKPLKRSRIKPLYKGVKGKKCPFLFWGNKSLCRCFAQDSHVHACWNFVAFWIFKPTGVWKVTPPPNNTTPSRWNSETNQCHEVICHIWGKFFTSKLSPQVTHPSLGNQNKNPSVSGIEIWSLIFWVGSNFIPRGPWQEFSENFDDAVDGKLHASKGLSQCWYRSRSHHGFFITGRFTPPHWPIQDGWFQTLPCSRKDSLVSPWWPSATQPAVRCSTNRPTGLGKISKKHHHGKIGKRKHFAKHGNIGINLMASCWDVDLMAGNYVICSGWILSEKFALQ